ncbi:MAG TPA: helix-turn-helix domain-containing protein [Leptospiraceae bacterium]|nr:helix-turn-helix domain-containing protein [Leptospiraceae bacterium]HMW03521.1 helix-turn-helix domain-containing protein [Leptospiraceae bacterium]HMX35466.1 helix-turn-helix domain-containing protein [Leptospiraceae bacterium]HMY29559.1 helix-turn-helix domain-containing protein [Leptospiraceae bacterium]HNA06002.1 helix-turn-helix domain-containing protein [Leptospiraceae bacterium]
MNLEWILQAYIDTGIFISVFFILKEILHLKVNRQLGFHFWYAFLAFIFQVKISILVKESYFVNPYLFLFSVSGLFIIGPFQRAQILKLFGKIQFRDLYQHYAILLITIPFEIFIIYYYPDQIPACDRVTYVGRVFSALGLIYYFVYNYQNERLFKNFLNQYKLEHTNLVLSYNRMVSVFVLFGAVSIFFSKKILFQIDGIFICTGAFVAIWYLLQYPDFFETISQEVAKQKYLKTSLNDLDLGKVKKELEDLMLIKKYYQDDEIYLDDVANELMINKNQLSRVLNEIYNKNFYQFINSYRILEAKELIVNFPEKTILDIAFDVGFKSKSAFYKYFTEQTGMTPQEYRKQNRK